MDVRNREPRICKVFSSVFVRPALLVLTSVVKKRKKKKERQGREVYFVQKSPGFAEFFNISFFRLSILVITSVFKKEREKFDLTATPLQSFFSIRAFKKNIVSHTFVTSCK